VGTFSKIMITRDHFITHLYSPVEESPSPPARSFTVPPDYLVVVHHGNWIRNLSMQASHHSLTREVVFSINLTQEKFTKMQITGDICLEEISDLFNHQEFEMVAF
jgi:hypothetical protein